MRTAVFTIISPNYRHTARVLMASLQRNQPEWDRFVLVVGGNQIADRGSQMRAQETIRSRFSPEAAGLRYRQRLQFLGLLEPS